MLEHLQDVKRNREIFLRNSIEQHIRGFFDHAITQAVDGHEFKNDSIEQLFPDYFEHDKKLGTIDEEKLMIIACMGLAYVDTDTIPRFFKIDALELAASALQESAFVQTVKSHNSVETVDERLESIESSDKVLSAAYKMLSPASERAQRISLKRVFTELHKDIVSGEVTQDTVEDILASLERCYRDTRKITDQRVVNGLRGEIATFKHLWLSYKKKGAHVSIPATMRGGSGRSNPAQTHDIDVLRQKRDGSWIVLPQIEVKRILLTDQIRKRYTGSLLAQVNLTGDVTISGEHRKIANL